MARDWDRWFRDHLPRLAVPEDEIEAAFGQSVGRPFRNEPDPRPGECPDCRRVVTVWDPTTERFEPVVVEGFAPGSKLYCPRCHQSGYDAQLYQQLGIAGLPVKAADGQEPTAAHDVPLPKYQRGLQDGPKAEPDREGGGADCNCNGASPASL